MDILLQFGHPSAESVDEFAIVNLLVPVVYRFYNRLSAHEDVEVRNVVDREQDSRPTERCA